MKKLFFTFVKIGLSLAIIVWLVSKATRGDGKGNVFEDLIHQPKDWTLLAGATLFCFAAVALTLIRWCYLVRALEIPLPMKDALRIGFLGYLVNFAPVGIVGGDLLKAIMLAREYPGQRAKAVASVVIDRLIGLYLLFVVATVAILLTGLWQVPVVNISRVCRVTFWATGLGGAVILVLMIPGVSEGRWIRSLVHIPRVGRGLDNLVEAWRMYRRKIGVLSVSAVMSVGVHCLFSLGVFLLARGLPGAVLPLGTFFVVMPLSAAAGVLPLSLGPFEAALEFLYTNVPANVAIPVGQGLVIALAYRLITVLIAAVGLGYYLTSRREVAEVMHEVEQEEAILAVDGRR